jgi:hypothetical protein
MKKALLFIGFISVGITSCKKDIAGAPVNTITATVNGVEESFNTAAYAELTTGAAKNSNLAVYGTNGSGTAAEVMSITLVDNETLFASSYTSGSSSVSSAAILYAAGVSATGVLNNSYITTDSSSPSTITITSLTGATVQGTFSGVLVDGGATKTVTNGQFNLALKSGN